MNSPVADAPMTQAEFARDMGVARSTVTRWKDSGRLVLDDDGRVLVAESKTKLKVTEGVLPAHEANRERLADARGRESASGALPPEPSSTPTGATTSTPPAGLVGEDALSKIGLKTKYEALRKLQAEADRAEMDRDIRKGQLVRRADVRKDVTDATAIILGAWENLPDRVAPLLTDISDQARIRALLRDEIERLGHEVAAQLQQIDRQHAVNEGEGDL